MKKQLIFTPDTPIKESAQTAGYLHKNLEALDHEESWVLFHNSANIPLTKKMITAGTIMSTPIDHIRIIKEALNCNATAMILFHNHPSSNPRPGTADIKEAEKLRIRNRIRIAWGLGRLYLQLS